MLTWRNKDGRYHTAYQRNSTNTSDEAAMLADRLYALHKGKTLQNGAPAEILRHPVDALIARLMGHTNIFSATIEGHYPEQGISRIN